MMQSARRLARECRTVSSRFHPQSASAWRSNQLICRPFSSSYDDEDDEPPSRPKKALVLGSSGALGSHVARYLSGSLNMQVLGADVAELPHELTGDWELDDFLQLEQGADLATVTAQLVKAVHAFCENDSGGIDAIICASGGWHSDPPVPKEAAWRSLDELVAGAEAYAETVNTMTRMNTDPVLAASYVAQHFMNPAGGLMVVIGATAALSPTPGMLGYGLSKSAAHFTVQTLGSCTSSCQDSKSIRTVGRKVRQHLPSLDKLTVVGILPTTLDTAANRKLMGTTAKTASWTKPEHISEQIGQWIQAPGLRPHSGALIKVHPNIESGEASFELVR